MKTLHYALAAALALFAVAANADYVDRSYGGWTVTYERNGFTDEERVHSANYVTRHRQGRNDPNTSLRLYCYEGGINMELHKHSAWPNEWTTFPVGAGVYMARFEQGDEKLAPVQWLVEKTDVVTPSMSKGSRSEELLEAMASGEYLAIRFRHVHPLHSSWATDIRIYLYNNGMKRVRDIMREACAA